MTTISNDDLFAVTEKNVVITGGGQGLGRTMALGLAQRGANIAIVDINAETAETTSAEVQGLGVRSMAIKADLTDERLAKHAITTITDQWGTIDVLINNAGMAVFGPAEEMSLDDFKSVFEIDVFAMFTCSKAAFGPMAAKKQGNIINISSICGMVVTVPQKYATYNSAKAGVNLLTKSLAVEWAPFNIRVNGIAPGYMLTPPVRALKAEDPERYEFWMSRIPMERAGEPEELVGTVVYLASEASAYMTGNVIVIDGGYTCL